MGRLALSPDDRKRISDAIRAAEAGHRGEIVVHIEPRVFGDPLKRAAKLFADKGVDRTKDHTGVLLYLATATRAAAVWAGTGVKDGAEIATWKPVFDALSAGGTDLTATICSAITALGKVLGERCPGADVHGDELGDGVSS